MSTPTTRSMEHLRKQGYIVAITEKWNPHARIRQDLFGFVDMIALKDGETLAVQSTSGSHVSDRVKKITEHENLAAVRRAGWRIVVHGWAKRKAGWTLREVDLS